METMDVDCLMLTYVESWKMYDMSISQINSLYKYFNSVTSCFLNKSEPLPGLENDNSTKAYLQIEQLGLMIWEKNMINLFEKNLINIILKYIQNDRIYGDSKYDDQINKIIFSLIEVHRNSHNQFKLYEDLLEGKLISEATEFYENKSKELLSSLNGSEYIMQVRDLLRKEQQRVKKLLPSHSHDKMVDVCRQQLVLATQPNAFLQQHAQQCVHNLLLSDLSKLYHLCLPIMYDGHYLVLLINQHIKNDIIQRINDIPNNEKIADIFIELLIELHSKYTEIVKTNFNNDSLFKSALDKAFNEAINHKADAKAVCQSPEHLGRYCDGLLKRGNMEIDSHLNNCITIFRYLDDKDVFNKFYGRMLAKRLIYCQYQSMEAEENMINKLKQVCGYDFTNKLHRMYLDVHISPDLNSKFNAHLKEQQPPIELNLAFNMLVLQAGAWPISSAGLPSFTLPQEFEKSVQMFEMFYAKNYSGRKLNWIHSFCQCDLKLNYLKRVYVVGVSTFVASLLLQFNNVYNAPIVATVNDRVVDAEVDNDADMVVEDHTDVAGIVGYKSKDDCGVGTTTADNGGFGGKTVVGIVRSDLQLATSLPPQQFNNALQQLLHSKLLIAEMPLTDSSKICLNFEYNNKRTKFKLIPAQKDTMQEVEQTRVSVNEDRKIYLQATIVRIMKARRSLKHNQLVQEVLNESKSQFTANVSLIKKCIESLIDKQYIQRVPNSNDQYSYIS